MAATVFFRARIDDCAAIGHVLGLSGLAVVMTVAFFYKIEFYPFTAMQLFTGLRSSDVTYYRVLGERESGERLQRANRGRDSVDLVQRPVFGALGELLRRPG